MMVVNKLETFWEVNDGSTGERLEKSVDYILGGTLCYTE